MTRPLTRRRLRPDPAGCYLDALFGRAFTDAQRAAAVAPLAPGLVVAGAGSGKTTVMAARVVHAVAHHGLAPSSILGLTFTNRAAGELRARVRGALADLVAAGVPLLSAGGGGPDDGLADDLPTVATYSSHAASLVRDHALRVGREPDARQLGDAEAWQLALRVVRRARGPFPRLSIKPENVPERVLRLDGEMSEHGVDVDAVRAADARMLREVDAAAKPTNAVRDLAAAAQGREELLDLVADYRRRKRELDLLDFADTVALAAEIAVGAPAVGAAERSRYALVLLDEYQDTSVRQRVLLQHLFGSGHPVTAVGDPCQAIYGWRGASAGNLLRFAEHFPRPGLDGYPPTALATSFRNAGRILDVANRVSEPLRRDGAPLSVSAPVLQPGPGRESAGEVRASWHPHVEAEAAWVAEQLAEAHARGTPWSGMAVLARARSLFPALHRALLDAEVPVEVVGLGGLLEVPEVADVVAVLEVLADPLANPALLRLLTGARCRIGPRDLAALGRRAAALARRGGLHVDAEEPGDDPAGSSALQRATAAVDPCDVVALSDALASPGDPAAYSREALERFAQLRGELEALRPVLVQPVAEAVAAVVAALGLEAELGADPRGLGAARAADLSAFVDAAVRFEAVEDSPGVAAFLGYLAAVREREDGWDPAPRSTADTVKLMTVHQAKGLEWDVVAVPGLAARCFPSALSRPRWTRRADALPVTLRGDRDDLPPPPELTTSGLTASDAAWGQVEQLEERRLAYVAVTRARDLVLASGAAYNATAAGARDPSPFLLEVREACLAGAGPVGPWTDDPGPANPLLAARGDVAFPAPLADAAPDGPRARRREAAALVAAALADPAPGLAPAGAAAEEVAEQAQEWAREAELLVAELRAEGSGAPRPVRLPAALSASQVVRLAADPDTVAAELARPVPRRPSRAARRGTAFHTWVEQRLGGGALLDEDDLVGAADVGSVEDADLSRLRAAFEATPYAGRTPVAVEVPFVLPLGGRSVRGRIDAVFPGEPPTDFEVVDWKTGDGVADPVQLAVYRLAWARRTGVDPGQVTAAFVHLPSGRVRRPALLDEAGLVALLDGPEA